MNKVTDLIHTFFSDEKFSRNSNKRRFFNEANLQFDLALFLKSNISDLEIILEYPINDFFKDKIKLVKKEIDIFIEFEKEYLIVELKFPKKNAGMPLAFLNALIDIQFCEQIKYNHFSKAKKIHFVTIFLTDKDNFKSNSHIYEVFKPNENTFNLSQEITLKDSNKTLRKGLKKINDKLCAINNFLTPWIPPNYDHSNDLKNGHHFNTFILKDNHKIEWKNKNNWKYYVHKF